MPKRAPTVDELADKFHQCLKDTGGLQYGELIRRYMGSTRFKVRAAKNHLKRLVMGIVTGEVTEPTFYTRARTRVFGRTDDTVFMDAKEASEKEPETDKSSYAGLGGLYNHSPVRYEWTHCPVTGKVVGSTIITMGVADFMECLLCSEAHFLGVNPRMKDRRLYAWQVDPLVNAAEYADAITTGFIGDPKTFRTQPSKIERVKKGGHYVGLWFRASWDEDPFKKQARIVEEAHRKRKTRSTNVHVYG